ncbi:MAG: LON peptidase substrate-binding domain-containing protein [Thiobacillus sp.]|uniref:LON peptidase substrate-binding domain-containing protein n=1 Tax=Thiobacillus sp. TaxID=924 RepID=UPI002893D7EC|nr:LON peptidase substrate-binding domain-containing protein [Thiobacillus sp.]MDT3708060.1 LON peptidase substrate-binding domain-containing protein [Thiobacillus sp.]
MSADFKPSTLPLFPLNSVVFPGGRLPLRIFEQRYLEMVKQAIARDAPFGICAIREGAETGTPAVPHGVGTRVRITDWDMPETGILHIDTRGQERFVIRDIHTEPSGLLVGTVESVSSEAPAAVPDDLELAVEILRHIVDEYGDTHFPAPHEFDNAVWVGYRLSEVLPLKLSTRQNLLEMNDSVMRLRILTEFLKKQIN